MLKLPWATFGEFGISPVLKEYVLIAMAQYNITLSSMRQTIASEEGSVLNSSCLKKDEIKKLEIGIKS